VVGDDGKATACGNSGLGILLGPGQFNWDASLIKTTKFTERQTLQFRAEFFNLFNHPQFNGISPGSGTSGTTSFWPQPVNAGPVRSPTPA
jgi:hypothetical protein